MNKEPEQYLQEIGKDEVFHLFHSILWRINENRKTPDKFVVLDTEIHKAIRDLFLAYEVEA